MKHLRFSLALLAATAISADAQTTVSTDPVGFSTFTLRAKVGTVNGASTRVIPMERASSFNGACTGATFSLDGSNRTVITFGSNLFTANEFTGTANQHYFRISNGSNEGDFSTVVANTENSITLADDFNAVLSVASAFEVVPYWTLSTALPGGGGLQGGTSATAADNVTIFNANFTGTVYFYNSTAGQWRTGLSNSDNVIIPPGSGLLFTRKQTSAVDVTLVGSVPLGTSAVDINGSVSGTSTKYTLVGSAYPLASKRLADLGLYTGDPSTGVVGGSSATAADNVTIFNPSTGVSTVYFYNTTASQWRTGLTASDNVTIPDGSAVLITRKNGRSPFTWYIPQPTMNL